MSAEGPGGDATAPDEPFPTPVPAAPLRELTGQQRRWLRARGHPLRPLAHVGGAGVTAGVISAIDRALCDHELVKVRLHQPADRHEAATALARSVAAHLCGVVGHTVLLYRPRPDGPRIVPPLRAPA